MQTGAIVMAIAVCISVQIFIGLVSRGLEKTLIDKVVGPSAHITLESRTGTIENPDEVKARVEGAAGIASAAMNVDVQGAVRLADRNKGVLVRDLDSEGLSAIYGIDSKIYQGRMISGGGEALIGKELADELGAALGDSIEVVSSGRSAMLRIVGLYDLGAIKLNKTWVLTGIGDAQALSGSEGIKSIEASVGDPYSADAISGVLSRSLGDVLEVGNWKDENRLLVSGIAGQKICSYIIQGFVLLGAVLSIVCILSVSVVQKQKAIGILKAMGMGDFQASMIFVFQSLFMVLIGIIVGVGFVFLYVKGFDRYIVAPDGSPVVAISMDGGFVLKSVLVSVAASLVAGVFPAARSFRLAPVEVIKR